MKVGWGVKPLGHVCEVKGGKRVPKGYKLNSLPTPYPYLTVSDFTDGGTVSDENLKYVDAEVFEQIRNYTISTDDIYLSIAGTIGKSGFVPNSLDGANLTENACKLVLGPTVLKEFIYYLTLSDQFVQQVQNNIRTAAQPKLSLSRIKTILIPIPPLEEQQRIVAVLDESFEGLALAQANTAANSASTAELFENTLHTLFTELDAAAPRKTLSEAAMDFGRGRSRHRPRNAPFLYGGPYPFIQTGDVRQANGVLAEYSQTYSEKGLAQSKLWPKGTVCITIAANIAETAVLGIDACFPDSVIGMVPDTDITSSTYVEYMLRFFAVDLKAAGKGSAQDNINLGTFENAPFPFPDQKTQNELVETLHTLGSHTNQLEEAFAKALLGLSELRQSLLQKAFAGELT